MKKLEINTNSQTNYGDPFPQQKGLFLKFDNLTIKWEKQILKENQNQSETQTFEFPINTSIEKHILKMKTLNNPTKLQNKLVLLNEKKPKSQNFNHYTIISFNSHTGCYARKEQRTQELIWVLLNIIKHKQRFFTLDWFYPKGHDHIIIRRKEKQRRFLLKKKGVALTVSPNENAGIEVSM